VSVASATATAADGAVRTADRLLVRPRVVVGSLIGLQVVATLVFAASVQHNGWVWFQGGDQIWLATQGWLLGQLELPPTELGYMWSLVLMPIMWVTGPTYVDALPPLVLFQVLVLGPVALLCIYDLASRIGGRLLGYWASFLWIVAPFAAIPLFVDRYQERFGEQFLPQALGLTAMSDYPSMVLALAAAVFVVRSIDAAHVTDAVLAGLLVGAAGAMKPPNLLVGVGAALAYVVAWRWREGVAFGAAIVPSLLLLAYWKDKGLGGIPVLSLEEVRVAAGSTLTAVSIDVDRYLDLDLDHWLTQMDELREFFWSARVAQWAPVAGLVAALVVRRGVIAALLGGWLGAFLVVKGFSPRATIESGSFWRLLMPAWPAYLLLFASIPLLVPTLARRLGERMRVPVSRPVAPRWVAAAAVLSLLVPGVVIAASSPLEGPELALTQDDAGNFILTSVDTSVGLRAETTPGGTRLTWDDDARRADVFYRVYRTVGIDVECENTDGHPAQSCYFRGTQIGLTREREYVDAEAPAEATYRIGVGTNWVDDPEFGDVFAFSPPVAGPVG
jgi:hypothetical protein